MCVYKSCPPTFASVADMELDEAIVVSDEEHMPAVGDASVVELADASRRIDGDIGGVLEVADASQQPLSDDEQPLVRPDVDMGDDYDASADIAALQAIIRANDDDIAIFARLVARYR